LTNAAGGASRGFGAEGVTGFTRSTVRFAEAVVGREMRCRKLSSTFSLALPGGRFETESLAVLGFRWALRGGPTAPPPMAVTYLIPAFGLPTGPLGGNLDVGPT
jgi:hypothetical protein